jgi:uncharacterized protein YneF (UPF0154 family)
VTKWIRIILIISLLLNVGLIIGFGFYKSYVKSQNFKLAAINAQAEASVLKNVLSELESGDPMKITALKEQLRKDIEDAQRSKEIWQRAAIK